MKRCADCGAKVEGGRYLSGWVRTNGDYSSACRTVMDGNRLLSADYHYVEGETQRHFRAEIETET